MKDITAKLYKPGEEEDYTGTAWLCSREYALTAAHCVGDRINRVLTPGVFTLSFLDFELKAEVKAWNPDIDVALLSIKGGEVPDRVQVTLKPLPEDAPWPVGTDAVRWQSWGYPKGKAGAMTLWGYIDASESYVTDDAKDRDPKRRQPAIQLTCEQGGYGNLGGISGSAVSNRNVVVGLVRCGPPSFEQRVIYASPLNRIAESFPEVREILDANLKQEIYTVLPSAARGAPAAPRAPELFGREHDIAEVGKLLREGARLLTFVGERGVGKTVLSQAVGRSLSDDYADGVYLVDLSLIKDAGRVAAEIAHALGVKESPVPDGSVGDSFEESLGAYLGDKQALIILDGFEELEGARQLVEGLLAKTGRLQFIVTCRAALRWARERVYAVGPISLDAAAGAPPESAPAVALFLKRARRANPKYTCGPATLGEIRGICETLGGLPLAVELAAGLSATPEFIPARVLERLKAVGAEGGGRLAALVELCYESLEESAQECLRRLSIFSGLVTLDAAEAVAASAGSDSQADARKELAALARRGLLYGEGLSAGEVCYRVPRPVLDHCVRQLEEAEETASARRAHALYYAQFTRKAERRLNLLTSAERRDWLKRLEAEHEEIRAALRWSLGEEGHADLALEIVGNMFWFWNLRAYLTEGRRWADDALAAARPALTKEKKETEALGKALYCAGGLAFMHGDYAAARATLEENVGVWERLPNHRRLGYALIVLGMVALNVARDPQELEEARGYEERCVKLFREVDDRWGLALALNDLANVCLEQGKDEEARSNYQQSLAVWRELGDQWGYGLATSNLGNLYYRAGDLLTAKQHLADAARLQRDEDNQWGWAESIKRLGHITLDEGDYAQAARLFYESMALHQKIGRKQLVADCLDGLARVAAALGRPAHSARLFGAATSIRRRIGAQMSQPQTAQRRTNIESAVAAATRKGMTREEFQTHWDEGEAWTLEVAVAEATNYAAGWRN